MSACSSSCGGTVIESAPVEAPATEVPGKIETKKAPEAPAPQASTIAPETRTVSYKVSEQTYVSRPVIVYYSR